MASSVVPVILCGGSGSRLWPMSRRLLPKQFLPLLSERTLFQDTALRMRGIANCGATIEAVVPVRCVFAIRIRNFTTCYP